MSITISYYNYSGFLLKKLEGQTLKQPSVNNVVFLFTYYPCHQMKAEFEQKDCARAVRSSVHGLLATVQVFPAIPLCQKMLRISACRIDIT